MGLCRVWRGRFGPFLMRESALSGLFLWYINFCFVYYGETELF